MGGWRVLLYGVLRKAFARLFTLNAAIPVAGKPSRWNLTSASFPKNDAKARVGLRALEADLILHTVEVVCK